MHNHDDKSGKGMMWMMVICCAVPLLLIFVLGAGGKAAGAPSWLILGGLVVMVGAHFFMMGKSHTPHRPSDEEKPNAGEEGKNKDTKDKNKSGHGCCD